MRSEVLLSQALEGVAAGIPRTAVAEWLSREYGATDAEVAAALGDALTEAQAQGVEREDIDPSWYR